MEDKPRNILLIQLGDIGDVVLTLPCIRSLRERYPEASISVAVREKAAGLLEKHRLVDRVISISKKKRNIIELVNHQIKFITTLNKYRFDLAIDLRTGTRGAIMAFIARARKRIGVRAHDEPFWRNWLFTTLIDCEHDPSQHIIDFLLAILSSAGIPHNSNMLEYEVSTGTLHEATEILRQEGVTGARPIIAVQPFSLWSYKDLPDDSMASLIKEIQDRHDTDIILIGAPAETGKASRLQAHLGGQERVYNLVGKTPIAILPGILKKCSLFIGIDSAGGHLSSAVGTKTAVIFGPSSPREWGPRGNGHVVIQNDLPCVPCRQKGCNGSETSMCLQTLDPKTIYGKLQPTLIDIEKARPQ